MVDIYQYYKRLILQVILDSTDFKRPASPVIMNNSIPFHPERLAGCSLAVNVFCNKITVTSGNIKYKEEGQCLVLK